MANFIQKIQTLFPAATVEGDATPLVTIPEEQWHDMALALRDDADLKFDYCVTVVGLDRKPRRYILSDVDKDKR